MPRSSLGEWIQEASGSSLVAGEVYTYFDRSWSSESAVQPCRAFERQSVGRTYRPDHTVKWPCVYSQTGKFSY